MDRSKRREHLELGHVVKHSWHYDSAFCETCDEWLEPVCSCEPADECPFPGPRPEKPSGRGMPELDLVMS